MVDIVFEPEPLPETRTAILEGLVDYNSRQTEGRYAPPRNIALSVRDPETGETIGGLTARIAFDRMFVELLYLPERLRGQGVGGELIARAESVAREAGCSGIWLDSYTFQAPDFYKKLGFSEFGTIADYPPGFSRHFLHKTLS